MKVSKTEIDKFNTEDFRNIFRLTKTYSLLNQLYNADSITLQEFQKQQIQILDKFSRIKQHLGNTDLQAFAEIYGIQQELKRMKQYKRDDIQSISIQLAAKIIEILDSIELYRQNLRIKQIINPLTDIAILLKKYKTAKSKISNDFVEIIDKINKIYEKHKKRSYTDSFEKLQIFEMEDAISKMRIQFYNHAGSH